MQTALTPAPGAAGTSLLPAGQEDQGAAAPGVSEGTGHGHSLQPEAGTSNLQLS